MPQTIASMGSNTLVMYSESRYIVSDGETDVEFSNYFIAVNCFIGHIESYLVEHGRLLMKKQQRDPYTGQKNNA